MLSFSVARRSRSRVLRHEGHADCHATLAAPSPRVSRRDTTARSARNASCTATTSSPRANSSTTSTLASANLLGRDRTRHSSATFPTTPTPPLLHNWDVTVDTPTAAASTRISTRIVGTPVAMARTPSINSGGHGLFGGDDVRESRDGTRNDEHVSACMLRLNTSLPPAPPSMPTSHGRRRPNSTNNALSATSSRAIIASRTNTRSS
mmetsp:Transcript_4105/g.13213  ORF Transcript_4105/g.13213 Transcript_4105/m.13213 type:complete len:207 (-) Transcript_4105:468-1088(-)